MRKLDNPFEALTLQELLLATKKPSVKQSIGNDAMFMGYVGRIVAAPGSRAIFDSPKDAKKALAKFIENENNPLTLQQLVDAIGSDNVAIMSDPRTKILQLTPAFQQMMAGAAR